MKARVLVLLFAFIANIGIVYSEKVYIEKLNARSIDECRIIKSTCSEGTCGENLTWIINNGQLIISGTGEMNNYNWGEAPWNNLGDSIMSVVINNGVTSIGECSFLECTNLNSIIIPNSVTCIGGWAFCNCYSLNSVAIPNSVKSIGDYAFSGCSHLVSINIPDSVTSISNGAFSGCSRLSSIAIPDGIVSIGNSSFDYCYSLTSFAIPDSVTSIGNGAFNNCYSLSSISIPNSVTSIDNGAFTYCYGLTSIVVESGNVIYDSRNNCNAVIETATNSLIVGCKETIIPNDVTSVGMHAFQGCSGLTAITIPNCVTNIDEAAFAGCSSLKNVIFGSSLQVIDDRAFIYCDSILSFTCYSTVPPTVVETKHTYNLPTTTIVYVPIESLSVYQMHVFWGRFDVRSLEASFINNIKELPSSQPKKNLYNNQLYILLPDGTRYDSTGKRVE